MQRVISPDDGTESWTVLADDWAPVEPVELFLAHLSDQGRSPNTVKAYAHDLKDYFAYLEGRGADWRRLRFDELAGFKPWLRLPRRAAPARSRRRPNHIRSGRPHRRGQSRLALHEPAIRDAIQRLRAAHRPTTSSAVPASQRASDASLLRQLEAAHARNRELATEIRQLREQLARAHGQLRAARLTPAPPSS